MGLWCDFVSVLKSYTVELFQICISLYTEKLSKKAIL